MFDLIVLALVAVCFAIAFAYASFCDDLLALPAGKDASP